MNIQTKSTAQRLRRCYFVYMLASFNPDIHQPIGFPRPRKLGLGIAQKA